MHYDDGFHYITRSFKLPKKFRYELLEDDLYHLAEHYTSELGVGEHNLEETIMQGYFEPGLFANIQYQIAKVYHYKEW